MNEIILFQVGMMISIKNLQKISGGQTALQIESLQVAPGEICALVSPAGSGKELLFDLLIDRQQPSAGTIELAGTEPADHDVFSRKVGVMFPDDALYPNMSPLENLQLQCQLHGLPRARALEVLTWIGMADQASIRFKSLPAGLQRRVAFGRAVLHQPQVLLLFEPFLRCDEASIVLLSRLIDETAEHGAAVLMLADDAGHLAGLCDRIYTLRQGRLVESDDFRLGAADPASFKIPVKLEDRVVLVNPGDILFAEAESGRASLRTREGSLLTQFTLAELEERLARSGFFRAHRSYLVNLQHVKEVIPFTRNSFSIRLDDEKRTLIPLSKAAAAELRDMLKY
jgi:ABC-2 type transport system ATP-binding protein